MVRQNEAFSSKLGHVSALKRSRLVRNERELKLSRNWMIDEVCIWKGCNSPIGDVGGKEGKQYAWACE